MRWLEHEDVKIYSGKDVRDHFVIDKLQKTCPSALLAYIKDIKDKGKNNLMGWLEAADRCEEINGTC